MGLQSTCLLVRPGWRGHEKNIPFFPQFEKIYACENSILFLAFRLDASRAEAF
jgi:hypothetical protein